MWSKEDLSYAQRNMASDLIMATLSQFALTVVIGKVLSDVFTASLEGSVCLLIALVIASHITLGFEVLYSRINLSGRWLGYFTVPTVSISRLFLTLIHLPALVSFGLVSAFIWVAKRIWSNVKQLSLDVQHRREVAAAHAQILALPNGEEVLTAYKLWQELEDLEAPLDEVDRAEALYRRLAEDGQRELPVPTNPDHQREVQIQRLVSEVDRLEHQADASDQVDEMLRSARLQDKQRNAKD